MKMTEAIKQKKNEIQAYIVPWRVDCSLLLPTTVVAEVLQHMEVLPAATDTDWIEGEIRWQGLLIPILSFDAVAGIHAKVTNEKNRILICRSSSYSDTYPFVAINFYGLPRLVFLSESSLQVLENNDETDEWPFIAKVDIEGTVVYIPDIEKLCSLL